MTGRCLQSCFLEISSRQSCSEKCMGRKNEDKLEFRGKTGSSTSELQLVTPLSRRRKRSTDLGDETRPFACPRDVLDDINIYPTIRKVERNQYENSNTSYVNISWYPIDEELTNFTSYVFYYWYDDPDSKSTFQFKYIERQKNETYVVYNESESGWRYGLYFTFDVIAPPCLSGKDRKLKRGEFQTSPCPNDEFDDINIYPTIRKVERNQYEDSNMSYVNISWYPINEGLTNFTSYVFVYWYMDMDGNFSRPVRFIERPKNETYMVYPESTSGWRYDMYFSFNVFALPCLSSYIKMKGMSICFRSPHERKYNEKSATSLISSYYRWEAR
ncbi:hypothetical protein OS493_005718 [Desmophyllum pertusum]|uniref:Uncharacterized protein n=1 Tax=Desmophyllum pertusum TaxID=174260 RepID=A0A9W9YF08_9CNID|nr:hypothetical protein OS493_005718 [Desmophyllum pertusum]